MNWMNWMTRLAGAYLTEVEIEAYKVYAKACAFFLGMLVLGVIAGLLNITEHRNWILVPMVAGMIVTPIFAFLPKIVLIAMGFGALVEGLKDRDITQGSVAGIIYLYRFVLGTFLIFTIFMGVLFIWSFAKNPVWLVNGLIGSIVLVTAIVYFEMKTGIWQWVVVGASVILIVLSFWYTRPDDVFPGADDKPTSVATAPVATEPVVITTGKVKWVETTKDGSLPVNEWSEWIPINPDCNNKLTLIGRPFLGQWRDHNGNEHDVTPGSKITTAEAMRFMATEAGQKELPFKSVCS